MDLIRACKYGDVDRCREILRTSEIEIDLSEESLSPMHWLLLGSGNSDEACIEIISMMNGSSFNSVANEVVLSGNNHLEKVSKVTALHLSVLYKGACVTKKLLELNANPDIQDSNGDTPLMYACRLNDQGKAEVLLLNGASAHLMNRSGESAFSMCLTENLRELIVSRLNEKLVKAVRKNSGSVSLELLLQARADVNACDKVGRSALALSLAAGNTSAVLSLLESNEIDASKVDSVDGHTCLHALVQSDLLQASKVEVLHELMFRRADVNAKSRLGKTALDLCLASQADPDLVRILQENGAEISKRISSPRAFGTIRQVSPISPSDEPTSPPNESGVVNLAEVAARAGSLLAELNGARASVDGIESYKSASNDGPQSIETEADLISQKVELLNKLNMYLSEFERVKGNRNRDFKSIGLFMELQKLIADSREEIARVNHRIESQDFVVSKGDEAPLLNVKCSWFRSPDSIEADIEGCIRTVRKSTGGLATAVEGSIFEVLKRCQTSQVIPILKLLRNRGADVNFREKGSGTTSLMLAAGGDSDELVDWLLANGADPTCSQKASGMTCLHIASMKGNKRICQLLIDKGKAAIINLRDKLGRTPLDICNNPALARILEPAASA